MNIEHPIVRSARLESLIVVIRSQKVMLSYDLAELYGVAEKTLNQAVKRNAERFPADFMFLITAQEFASLRSQIVTSSLGHGGRRYLPSAFTEQGVAMLSSVLRSPRAVRVNIELMRTFVKLRQLLATHAELAGKLEALERKYDGQFKVIFEAVRELMAEPEPKPKPIGFHVRERRAMYRVGCNGR